MYFYKKNKMQNDCISYQESGYFSKLITAYLDQQSDVKSLYHRFPTLENFKAQLEEKAVTFNSNIRSVLVNELEKQYKETVTSTATANHISLLKETHTFTITTGHQLNLFTGPVYFIYKIVSTLNLCKQLQEKYPAYHFVPVYWMATEDHDFEEINHFKTQENSFTWQKQAAGAVGELSTEGLDEVAQQFFTLLNQSEAAVYLQKLFSQSYLSHNNLADATRFLVNELFKEHGLVIIDGNAAGLKKLFTPYLLQELNHQTTYKEVSQTNLQLSKYNVQVNPREINLFYLQKGLRERIIFEDNCYKVHQTTIQFSPEALKKEVENFPERFSPNVLLRPLYQEVILPNLAYVGGGGELAYWLQLKTNFNAFKVCFPILVLRNSVLLVSEKQAKKIKKLKLQTADLFLPQQQLLNDITKRISQHNIDFSVQKQHLETQFKQLYEIASQTDKSFIGAIKAQEIKQIKGLENLEKRLLKAEKRKHGELLQQVERLQNELFPNHSLQERQLNFSQFYMEYGQAFIDQLFQKLNPLAQNFNVITLP